MNTSERAERALNRLSKWRLFYAGWQYGTQPKSHGLTCAVRDAAEARLIVRAEVSALTALLINKGVFTVEEMTEALAREADWLCEALEKRFPGVRTTEYGLEFDIIKAGETMKREGFPP